MSLQAGRLLETAGRPRSVPSASPRPPCSSWTLAPVPGSWLGCWPRRCHMRRHPPARPRRPKPCCPRWRSAGPTSRGSCGQASQPIDDGRGEGAGREKQDGAAIVAGCDPTPALEMCEHVFDPAAQAIAAGVARDRTFPADAGGDAWRNASFDQGIAKPSGPTASNACRASSAGHRPQGVRPAHPNRKLANINLHSTYTVNLIPLGGYAISIVSNILLNAVSDWKQWRI